jgi:Predicted glycosyltransferases
VIQQRENYFIGAVIIGRNEGQRLITCLESLIGKVDVIIYVDSGSSDNSIQEARARKVDAIALDLSLPFTAARARNIGAQSLIKRYPNLAYIQFVDGDCEMEADWFLKAELFLNKNTEYAAVSGRLHERFPKHSIYNQLMDIEWDTPIGDTLACGGITMMRADSFNQVDGFRDDMIAGEEPEICFRMRAEGWNIYRLDTDMARHDAAMTKISQWWKRTVRTGYAFALGRSMHGESKERYWVKENQRIIIWGLFIPILILGLMIINPSFLGLSSIYLVQIVRVANKRADLAGIKFIWATSVVLGKIPEALGLLRFWQDKMTARRARIIEYK